MGMLSVALHVKRLNQLPHASCTTSQFSQRLKVDNKLGKVSTYYGLCISYHNCLDTEKFRALEETSPT